MNDKEILDNAPKGAKSIYISTLVNKPVTWLDGNYRSLADIKRIAELEGQVDSFCSAIIMMPVCDSHLYSLVDKYHPSLKDQSK